MADDGDWQLVSEDDAEIPLILSAVMNDIGEMLATIEEKFSGMKLEEAKPPLKRTHR